MSGQLKAADKTYAAFTTHPASAAKQVPSLVRSVATIRELRRRVDRLEPPPVAAKLHVDLLRLLALQAATAGELLSMVRYLVAAQPAAAALARTNDEFRRSLPHAKTGPAETQVLRRYAGDLRAVTGRFRRLEPPSVLRPAHEQQLTTLERSSSVALRLADAIANRDRAAIRQLVPVFESSASVPAGRETQAAAIRAYDARLRRINAVATKVQQERLRIEKALS